MPMGTDGQGKSGCVKIIDIIRHIQAVNVFEYRHSYLHSKGGFCKPLALLYTIHFNTVKWKNQRKIQGIKDFARREEKDK